MQQQKNLTHLSEISTVLFRFCTTLTKPEVQDRNNATPYSQSVGIFIILCR